MFSDGNYDTIIYVTEARGCARAAGMGIRKSKMPIIIINSSQFVPHPFA